MLKFRTFLIRKRKPGICLAIFGVGIIGMIPDIADGIMTGSRWQPGMIILPENGLWEKRDERMEKFLRVKCINVKRGIEHL